MIFSFPFSCFINEIVAFFWEVYHCKKMDDLKPKAMVFVVSGASGSGKTTLCRKIAQKYGMYYSISHTTRPKRPHEQDEKDYFFVTVQEFKNMITEGIFLEWAEVYGNYYGTSRLKIEESLKQQKSVILDVDTQGASSIKKMLPQAVLVFIDVPSLEVLRQRLNDRSTDSEQEINKRVLYAKNEIAKKDQYDYIIINDDLEHAEAKFDKIIGHYCQ